MDLDKFNKAVEARDKFLEENPRMKAYQAVIDAELDKAGESIHNRMAVLENMLLEKRAELLKELKGLEFSVKAMGEYIKYWRNNE